MICAKMYARNLSDARKPAAPATSATPSATSADAKMTCLLVSYMLA